MTEGTIEKVIAAWSPHEIAIFEILSMLADYYSVSISKNQFAMYVADLAHLTISEIKSAVQVYRRDPRNDRFPIPAKLTAIANPATEIQDVGVDTANRIVKALSMFGSYRVDEAKAWLGALAWAVVDAEGGWAAVCHVGGDQLNICKAQWRELAKVFAKKSLMGMSLDQAFVLEGPKKETLSHIGAAFKLPPVQKPDDRISQAGSGAERKRIGIGA